MHQPPQQPHPHYGSHPYGPPSPSYGPYPIPPVPGPARKRSSRFVPIYLSLCGLLIASCSAFVGYAVYEAQTPEGKAKIAADKAKAIADVDAASAALAAVLRAVPAADAPPVQCPAGLDARRAPTVDSIYLERVTKGPSPELDEQVAALEKIRSREFSTELVSGTDARRAGMTTGDTGDAGHFGIDGRIDGRYDATRVLEANLLVVLDVGALTPARVEGGAFEGGALEGRVVVIDRSAGKALCHAPITAASSESVEYGGGVRLKVRGIPTPTMGKKSLDEAVAKDFATNVKTAVKGALKTMGAAS